MECCSVLDKKKKESFVTIMNTCEHNAQDKFEIRSGLRSRVDGKKTIFIFSIDRRRCSFVKTMRTNV